MIQSEPNYIVVLFKNKSKKKIINKFKTKERAVAFYKKLIEENDVIFDCQTENGASCFFELGLLEKNSSNFDLYFIKDDMGRQVKVELDTDDFKLIEVRKYKVEELIYDVEKKEKLSVSKFIRMYLPKTSVKLLSKLNNKVVLQNDDNVKLFSLKSEDDADRFLDSLGDHFIKNGRMDCILVKDTSKSQKKYLYNVLQDKGIDKSVLYRRFTTFRK
jgi:hypothetical protein